MTENEYLALPVPQRKKFQEQLKAKGLYLGPIDGKSGDGMRTGLKAMEREKIEGEERARQGRIQEQAAEAQAEKDRAKAERERAAAETTRIANEKKRRYDENATSPEGIATQIGTYTAAPIAGTALGMAMGKGTNFMMDRSQESRNRVLQGAARDRIAGLTTREGAREGARLAGALPMSSPAFRTAARMAPHMGLGALSIGKGLEIYNQEPTGEFYPDMANQAAGLGYIGAGAGLAKQGLRYGNAPGVAPDAQAIAVINSNQLRRGGKLAEALGEETASKALSKPSAPAEPDFPDEPAPKTKPVAVGSKAYIQQQLRDLGVRGTSRMPKTQLAELLAEQMKQHGGKRTVAKKLPKGAGKAAIPLAVGSYMAATGDSEAAGATPGERAADAAQNFGIGAGAAYGGSKLVDALSRVAPQVMTGLGSGLTMAVPGMSADMTDVDQENLNMARNTAARTLPDVMQFGAVGEARDMAQVPERSPANSGPRLDAPALQNRLRRMSATGASPDQIASFLNMAFSQ